MTVPRATDVTVEELGSRLHEEGLLLVDVRTPLEYRGAAGYPCDPRQGHIPGARSVPLEALLAAAAADVQALVGGRVGSEVIVYCHSGQRSAMAAATLERAGYRARNYAGSWHEWSRRADLPAEGAG